MSREVSGSREGGTDVVCVGATASSEEDGTAVATVVRVGDLGTVACCSVESRRVPDVVGLG